MNFVHVQYSYHGAHPLRLADAGSGRAEQGHERLDAGHGERHRRLIFRAATADDALDRGAGVLTLLRAAFRERGRNLRRLWRTPGVHPLAYSVLEVLQIY